MLLRSGYTIVVPSVFIVLYFAFRVRGWLGNLLSLLLTLAIFALALGGVWAIGTTESGLLSGVIPMFDSDTYYIDSLRLLAGQEFSEGSSTRPIFIAFFAFLLWIVNHHLLSALALLALFVSLACFLLTGEIAKTHGPAIAIFVLVIIFIYYRYHSGVVRTENLGVLFGALGAALIWRGISKSQPLYFLAGISLTSIGMIARAGAFFILPLLVVWGALLFKQKGTIISWQFLIGGMIAVSLPFLANRLIILSFGTSHAVPFGNFSYSLYGLASGGKSWAYVHQVYPGASDLEIYQKAIQLILTQPNLFVKGVLYNYSMFFSNTPYGLFSYMGGEGGISSTVSYWALMILSALGVWSWFRERANPYLGFVIVSAIGLLLSVPFLPPTDAFRLRVYATSVVVLALLPAMGLNTVLTKLKVDNLNPKNVDLNFGYLLGFFSVSVALLVLVGPYLSKGTNLAPEPGQSSCGSELTSIIVRYNPGSMVHIVSQNTPLLDWAPTFHIGTLRRSVHGFPNFNFMGWALESVTPNHTLFSALDYRSFRNVLVVAGSDSLPAPPAWMELCGDWEENPDILRFNIFYASYVNPVDK